PLMMAVAALLMDLDSPRERGAADGARPDAAGVPAELPRPLGLSLYALIAVSALVIGGGAGALAGDAGAPAVMGAAAIAAALGPGAAGAALLRRYAPAADRQIRLNVAGTVGLAAFLLAMQWAALWIVMFDSGWIP
ncbi:MAG TPA: hypothetical protein VFY65_00245, partial [Longimicrobium sp.]|nr:hypothetical protein [Longimicrobium sp.]